jgi:hypothetical protein
VPFGKLGEETVMAAAHGGILLREPSMDDQDIFRCLLKGVDERAWGQHAEALRSRGYSIFDMTGKQTPEVEIIDPDCANWWKLSAGHDGRWRLC